MDNTLSDSDSVQTAEWDLPDDLTCMSLDCKRKPKQAQGEFVNPTQKGWPLWLAQGLNPGPNTEMRRV